MRTEQIGDSTLYLGDCLGEQPEPQKVDMFQNTARNWRESTLGATAERDPEMYETKPAAILSEGELAFFILTNTSANSDTPCLIGDASKRKAIRVGGTEYRCLSGVLHGREIAA